MNVGDRVPEFVAPMAGGDAYNDVREFSLSAHLIDGPLILAFYPAAFTGGCTEEMCQFRDSMSSFEEVQAHVFGISVDLPYALNIFIAQQQLNFPMLSDTGRNLIHIFDVAYENRFGLEVARRSVFVIDSDETIRYKWVKSESENPNFSELIDEIIQATDDIK